MKTTKIAIVGASGRMGRELLKAVLSGPDVQLAGAVTHSASASLGIDAGVLAGEGECGVSLTSDFNDLKSADVIIDFALPDSLAERLQCYQGLHTPVVLCTTGLDEEALEQIRQTARNIPLLYAANTSVGINTLLMLVEQASSILGTAADIEIVEAHHTAKKDAPSGTALVLGEAAARGRGQKLNDVAELNRNQAGLVHTKGSIGFATIRAGDIVGEHTVYLVTGGERLELSHRVASRSTFADGAIRAACWLSQRAISGTASGFFQMSDVLRVDEKA